MTISECIDLYTRYTRPKTTMVGDVILSLHAIIQIPLFFTPSLS